MVETIPNKEQFAEDFLLTRTIPKLTGAKAMQGIQLRRRNQVGIDCFHEKRSIDAGIHSLSDDGAQLPGIADTSGRIAVDNRKLS